METIKIDEEIRSKLRAPFPPEAISQHPTKTFLSTIKAIYVVERLNDLFGIAGWTIEHEIISDTPEYVTVKGRLVIFKPYDIATPYQFGGHNKTGKNTEPADGYKSAVTDCQSKCASYLEIGIDIFKGKVTVGNKNKVPSSDVKEMSGKQWDFIKKIGIDNSLSEPEIVELIKYVAKKNKVEPRHWKIAKALLPENNFKIELNKQRSSRQTCLTKGN